MTDAGLDDGRGERLRHAADLPIAARLIAYAVVLVGYILYCYNFVVTDYVRPYLISDLGFSIEQTAIIFSAQNVGISMGAICWAGIVARAGRRRAAFAIAATIGITAALQAGSGAFATWVGARALLAATLGGYYVVATSLVVALFPVRARGKMIAINSTMYPASNIIVGLLGAGLGDAHWHVLLWIGALPLPLSFLLYAVIPDDRRYRAYDDDEDVPTAQGSWREMLGPQWRWLALGCVALSGIDFNAYSLFMGFVTIYIKQSLGLSATAMGSIVATISSGSLIGNFLWAILSDRYGRRPPLIGYLLCAAAILVFLRVGPHPATLAAVGFAFGLGLSCTATWGAWFAEIFPLHLRPHGAALFHAGHVLAIGAPLFAAWATATVGLATAMGTASAVYVAGAILWFMLPETLVRHPAPPESPHSSLT